MQKQLMGILVGVVLMIGVAVLFFMDMSFGNSEIKLRNLYGSQEKVIEANFDKMWKVLSQKAQISEQSKEAFKEIYIPMLQGRMSATATGSSGTGSGMMMWLQEQNPQFDQSVYKDLMVSVEALRTEFFYEQKKIISIAEQHQNLCMLAPGSWFIDAEPIYYEVISSEATKETMETREENNISLF